MRNNPHIPLPANGTFLDASDRARLLRDITVRFGDVEARKSIGRSAIDSFEEMQEPDIEGVRKGHCMSEQFAARRGFCDDFFHK